MNRSFLVLAVRHSGGEIGPQWATENLRVVQEIWRPAEILMQRSYGWLGARPFLSALFRTGRAIDYCLPCSLRVAVAWARR